MTVLKILTFVDGHQHGFHTVMGEYTLAMCKCSASRLFDYCVCCNRIHPVKVGADTIYFRGIRVLDTVIGALLTAGVSSAEHVILTGGSGEQWYYVDDHILRKLFLAGGLSTYLHADHVRKMVPSNIPMHSLADAGYVYQKEL